MNELKLYENNDKIIDFQYDIFVPEKNLIGTYNNDIEIKFSEGQLEIIEDDFIDIEFDSEIPKTDKADYLLAASCGILSGALSVLWSKEFSLDEAQKWGNEKADEVVTEVAKSMGYKGDDLKGAISYLEKMFPMAGDALTNAFGGGKQHHLRDFSHHASPVGLICSILMQFMGEGFGTDTQGKFIPVKITKDGVIGKNFAEKIVFGTVNWMFHLVSDMDGSSSSVFDGSGKGTGIPGPFLSLLKELSALPLFHAVDEKNINKPKLFSQFISKLFNGTLIKNEDGTPIRFDLRTEMGIGHQLVEQAKPVIINECLVRTCFFISRFIAEVKEKDIHSFKELENLDVGKFIPMNNRVLIRMITVSSGSFVAINLSGVAVKSAIHSKGDKEGFCKEFFLSINYVGIGRFVFACASDAQYIKDDISDVYRAYIENKERERKNQYTLGYQFLTLNDVQAQLLYSLKAISVTYDIENTKDKKKQAIKKIWLEEWKKKTLESLGIDDNGYFLSEEKVYVEIYDIDAQANDRGWLYLLSMELALFQAYYNLTDNDGNLYSGLSYGGKYLFEILPSKQMLISKKDIEDTMKQYKSYVSKLNDVGKKTAIGVGVTAITTVATGGLVLAFAPEIAVVLAGGSFAGLSGAALTSASLASIGGGSLAAGGLGMAGGTAILTGGGALLGMAGSSTASLISVVSKVSEKFTLNECAKLLTFCKTVLIEKYDNTELIEPLVEGIRRCSYTVEQEIMAVENDGTKEEKKSLKRMKSCSQYLKNCERELLLLVSAKDKNVQGKKMLLESKKEKVTRIEEKR